MIRVLTAFFLAWIVVWAQDPTKMSPEARRQLEQRINQRNKDSGGILVSEPKVFDDSLLQQMLNAAEAKLASMQVFDTTSLGSHLGAVTGGQQTVSGIAISAQTPSLPGVTTVANGATGSTVNTVANAPTGTTTTNQVTTGQPVTNVTTTLPSFGLPTATLPPPTTALPTTFGVSSSNILSEQMQLTYEITNLRLLLEGSLSDRFVTIGNTRLVRPRTTIGFFITLTPRFKNAVAIVEVEVETAGGTDLSTGEAPIVTALLPKEKTYNVASIRESNVSIGLGAVTQVFGIAGSFFHGSKSFFLVQEQDTVALPIPIQYPDAQKRKVAFLWQFRPVLGGQYIPSGTKQTFVQLAFPEVWTADSFGKVSVTSYWCKYDQSKGLVGEVIKDSLRKQYVNLPMPNLKIEVGPKGFSNQDIEDMGTGQVLVHLHQHFLTDTAVRIGSTILNSASGNFSITYDGIEFVASLYDLMTKRATLLARDGSELPLVIKRCIDPPKGQAGQSGPCQIPEMKNPVVSTVDDTNSLVKVEFDDPTQLNKEPPFVFLIGNRVFGYRDAPFLPSDGVSLRAIVPTALVAANPVVLIKPLFAPDKYVAVKAFNLTQFAQGERVVLLEQNKESSSYLLYGSRLSNAQMISPAALTPGSNLLTAVSGLTSPPDQDSLRQFTLTSDQVKAHTQVLIQRPGEHPIVVALPGGSPSGSPSGTGTSTAQTINVNATVDLEHAARPATQQAPALVNDDKAVFSGNDFKNLQSVIFNGKSIPMEVSLDGKSVQLTGLKVNQVTADATTQLLQFVYKANIVPVKLEVVRKGK